MKKGRFSPVVTWLDGAVVLREHLGADSEEFGTDCPNSWDCQVGAEV